MNRDDYDHKRRVKRISVNSASISPEIHLIPSRLPILKKELLYWPWERLKFDEKGIEDIVLNLVGFMPLGFVVTWTLAGAGGVFEKKAAFIALFFRCGQPDHRDRSSLDAVPQFIAAGFTP